MRTLYKVRCGIIYVTLATLMVGVLPVRVFAQERSAESSENSVNVNLQIDRQLNPTQSLPDLRLPADLTENFRSAESSIIPSLGPDGSEQNERAGSLDGTDTKSFELNPDLVPEVPGSEVEPEPEDINKEGDKDKEEDKGGMVAANQYWGDKDDKGNNQSSYDEWGNGIIPPLKIDESTGVATYNYPLDIPKGRNGLQPDLTLRYSSNNHDNSNNIYGYGWTLDTGYVMRRGKTGKDNLYTENEFVLNIYGSSSVLKPVNLSDGKHGVYGAEIEGAFYRVEFLSNESWLVTDKSGTKYRFGFTPASRQDDPANAAKIYKWMLDEQRDTNDNFISFSYFKDAGQIYPDTIVYTEHGTAGGFYDGIFVVHFNLKNNENAITAHNSQFAYTNKYKVSGISAEANGAASKVYNLLYEDGGNGSRQVLSSITYKGYDGAGSVIILPPTIFTYNKLPKKWLLDEDPGHWDVPFGTIQFDGKNIGVRFVDVNGDGLVDVIKSQYKNFYNGVYINNGHDWELDTAWQLPDEMVLLLDGGNDIGARFADVNGDSLIDIILGKMGSAHKIYVNNGSGWEFDASRELPVSLVGGQNEDEGVRFIDVNADNLVDIVKQEGGPGSNGQNGVYLNDGKKWMKDTTGKWKLEIDIAAGGKDQGTRFADVNGDGLIDVVQGLQLSGQASNKVYLNNGEQWVFDADWVLPALFTGQSEGDQGVRFVEVNGDGLVDVVRSFQSGALASEAIKKVWINTGDTWVLDEQIELPVLNTAMWGYGHDEGTRFVDVNGDGLTDIVNGEPEYGKPNRLFVYINQITDSAPVDDLLINIESAEGSVSEIKYLPSAQYKTVDGALLNPKLPSVVQTVKEVLTDDGMGNEALQSYVYKSGKFYEDAADIYKNGFAGFKEVEIKDPENNLTKLYFDQGDANNYHRIGRPLKKERFDPQNKLFKRSISNWVQSDLGKDRKFVKLASEVLQNFDGTSLSKDGAIAYEYDDSNGNLVKEINYGEVDASADGSFSDIIDDKRTFISAYAGNPANSALSALSSETLLDNGGNKVAETRYYYDNQPLHKLSAKLNLTKTENWLDTSNEYLSTNNIYNEYGLVTATVNPRAYKTSFTYDNYNLYPVKVTNAKGHQDSLEYNLYNGAIAKHTDPNGIISVNEFDSLNRVVKQKVSSSESKNTLLVKTQYIYDDFSMPRKFEARQYMDAANYVGAGEYRDGLGRIVQKRAQAEGSNYVVQSFAYDKSGNLKLEYLPHFATGALAYSASQKGAVKNTYYYDAMSRPVKISNIFGDTKYTYKPWQTTVIDANGNKKSLYYDAAKRLLAVDEHNQGAVYQTEYEYTPHNKLSRITDSLGNERNFKYDSLARLKQQEDLHAPGDNTFATWGYAYDKNGNLAQLFKPEGQMINYYYDQIDRILTEDYTAQSGIEVTHSYDGAENGIGRLEKVQKEGFSSQYEYDNQGNLKEENRIINGQSFSSKYTYNLQGKITEKILPDNTFFNNVYNSAGLLEKVRRKSSPVSPKYVDLISNYDYSPAGQVSKIEYANGAVTDNTYDPAKLYRLTAKKTKAKISKYVEAPLQEGSPEPVSKTEYFSVTNHSMDGYLGVTKYFGWPMPKTAWAEVLNWPFTKNYNTGYPFLKVESRHFPRYTYNNYRSIVEFDTGKLPSDAVIESAYINLYPLSNVYNSIRVTGVELDSADKIQGADYGKVDNKSLASLTNRFLSAYKVQKYKLNKDGINYVKKGGKTAFALKTIYDYAEINPWNYSVKFASANNKDFSLHPKLEVTYKVPAKEEPPVLQEPAVEALVQNLQYTYDAVGNLTKIVDSSASDAAKTTTYAYDDLYRLTAATVANAAVNENYTRNYTYDALGNMTYRSDVGYFTYGAGTKFNQYANPHALSGVKYNGEDSTQTLIYGKNGNLLKNSDQTLSWDYNDRLLKVEKLAQSDSPAVSNTFAYDQSGQRIKKNGDIYAFDSYEVEEGGKIIKRIAEISIESQAGKLDEVYGNVKDHLSGSSLMLSADGEVVQLLDYYPYGSTRLDQRWTDFNEKHKFTGHELDDETGLYYANARYYNSSTSRFISLDPAALNNPQRFLTDPQQLNLYSYARNNPVKYVDPSGEFAVLIPAVLYSAEAITALATIAAYGVHLSVSEQNRDYRDGITATPAYEGRYKPYITVPSGGELSNRTVIPNHTPQLPDKYTTPAYQRDPSSLIHTGMNYEDVPKYIKDQVPKEWGKGEPSKHGDGWKWFNPDNKKHGIRFQKAKPGSEHPSQRRDYVRWNDSKGQPLDVNGARAVPEAGKKPGESSHAHIDAKKFKYNANL